MFIRWKKVLDIDMKYKLARHNKPYTILGHTFIHEEYIPERYAAYLVKSFRADGKVRQEQHYIASYTTYGTERLSGQWKIDEWERNRLFWDNAYHRLHQLRVVGCKEWPEIVKKLSERIPVTPTNYLD